MKLLIIIVDTDHSSEVRRLLDECGLPGYTEIPSVLGKGETGRKFGNRVFPGSSTLFLAAVEHECATRLPEELRKHRDAKGREEGLKVYSLDTTEVL